MNLEQAEKIQSIFESGCLILIDNKICTSAYKASQIDASDSGGTIEEGDVLCDTFSGSYYQCIPLKNVEPEKVKTFTPFDWFIPEESPHKTLLSLVKSLEPQTKPTRALTDEMYDDLVTTALEGGITGWCSKCTVKDDDFRGAEFASDVISKGGTLILKVYESLGGEIKELTAEMIDEALVRTGRITMGIGGEKSPWLASFFFDGDGIDAVEADIIVQEAIFGSVIYS